MVLVAYSRGVYGMEVALNAKRWLIQKGGRKGIQAGCDGKDTCDKHEKKGGGAGWEGEGERMSDFVIERSWIFPVSRNLALA